MSMGARLRGLDRRVESAMSVRKPKYDVEPPNCLQYSCLTVIMAMAALSTMVSVTAGPTVAVVTTAVLLTAWLALVLSWVRRHRVRD
jgi:hypothetical protein